VFDGVQFIPHVTQIIKDWFYEIDKEENPDVIIIEIGGTVGDLENQFYIEAIRQLKREVNPSDLINVHLTYVPLPSGVGEQKSKPTQMSVRLLNEKGIEPDIIIGRSSQFLSQNIKQKIASYSNIHPDAIISGVDVECVYENPLIYEREGLTELLHNKLGIYSPPNLRQWTTLVNVLKSNMQQPAKTITIALCGKYTELEDSYASVVEALVHCEAKYDVKIKIKWIDSSKAETESPADMLQDVQGVIVPGGFGHRGIEGKINIIQYVRENNIPYLGICYGMQLAVVEYARHVCGLEGANTTEIEEETGPVKHPVVKILPEQVGVSQKGGTMRLGGHDIEIKKGTLAAKLFGGASTARQRFRHRFEVNPDYISKLEEKGLIFSGKAPKQNIMQILELPNHKFFVGCQFHPELTSSLLKPSELFSELIHSILK